MKRILSVLLLTFALAWTAGAQHVNAQIGVYYQGWVTDGDGKRYCALFNTEGEQLTTFSDTNQSYFELEDMTDRLEEYRIY